MPAIAISPNCVNPHNDIINDIVQREFNGHLNLTDLLITLNELFAIETKKIDEQMIVIICRIKEYMKSNLIKNIFKYFTQNIDLSKENLNNNLKKLLLQFCDYFLMAYSSLCSESKNNNNFDYSFFGNHQETFNNYFIFLNSLFAIPGISDITLKTHHDAFSLINLSQGLLTNTLKLNSTDTAVRVTYFLSALGQLAFNLGLEHNNESYISTIDGKVVLFYNTAENKKVASTILIDAIWKYSLLLKGNDTEAAQEHCEALVGQTCLAASAPAVTTVQNSISASASHPGTLSTTILASEAMRTESLVETTTRTSYAPQNVTLSSHNNTRNETESNVTLITTHSFPSAVELGTAFGHGIGNGVINALSQQLSVYLNKAGYSRSRIPAVALNLATILVHSGYAATLPFILLSMQNPDTVDDNTKDEMWERITQQVIPTFFTNLGFGLGFQLLNHYQTHYLSRFLRIKAAVQTIPVASTAYAAISAPISTAVNIATATASSLLTTKICNFFSASKNKASQAVEIPLIKNSINSGQEIVKEPIVNSKTYGPYIQKDKLITIRKDAKTLLTNLEAYIKLVENSIATDENNTIPPALSEELTKIINKKYSVLNEIKLELDKLKTVLNLLEDEMHEKSCEKHTVKGEYLNAMHNLGNVFKSIVRDCTGTKEKITLVKGELKGNENIFTDSDSIMSSIGAIDGAINSLLQESNLYLSIYNTAEIHLKGKEEGAKEAELLNDNSTATILRNNNKESDTIKYSTNRRNTIAVYSSASDDSNSSITLSTISGSSTYDPVEPQQERPLLKISR